MVRASQSTTFSSAPYFDDRGPYGEAQPITERVHVSLRNYVLGVWTYAVEAAFTPYRVLLLPRGHGGIPLWCELLPIDSGHTNRGVQQYHPMKPHRLTLVNALVIGYGLDKQIHNIYNPPPASRAEILGYHDKDYVDFLSRCAQSCLLLFIFYTDNLAE